MAIIRIPSSPSLAACDQSFIWAGMVRIVRLAGLRARPGRLTQRLIQMQSIIKVWTSIRGKRCRIEIAVIRMSRMSALEQPPRTWLTIRLHASRTWVDDG